MWSPSYFDLSPSDILDLHNRSVCMAVQHILPTGSEDDLVCPQMQVLAFHLLVIFLNLLFLILFSSVHSQGLKKWYLPLLGQTGEPRHMIDLLAKGHVYFTVNSNHQSSSLEGNFFREHEPLVLLRFKQLVLILKERQRNGYSLTCTFTYERISLLEIYNLQFWNIKTTNEIIKSLTFKQFVLAREWICKCPKKQ